MARGTAREVAEAWYNRTQTHGPLRAQVETRIYPGRAAQNAERPYLVWKQTDGTRVASQGGTSGLRSAAIQAWAVADTPREALDVADTLLDVWDGYRGETGGVFFQRVTADATDAIIDGDAGAEQDERWVVNIELACWYTEDTRPEDRR